jgi:ubiquinone/menaquinone biosynthesis C-methylase UbiE
MVNKAFNPDITVASYLVRNRLFNGVKRYTGKLTGNLLDFGCGSKPYRSLFSVEKYTGLDFNSQGHDHTDESIDVFYDGCSIPFGDNTFDAVFSSEVFEHVFNLEEILPEINRVLKQDGLILITCPFAICEHEQPNDYARYSSFALKYLMEKNGFEVLSYEKLGGSIDVIVQMRLTYFHNHIMPFFSKIPVLRKIIRTSTNVLLNTYANLHSKIFPIGDELYLNNLMLCKKK